MGVTMPTELPPFDPTRSRWPRHSPRDEGVWNAAAVSIPAIAVLLAAMLPGPLVLPALSMLAILCSIAMSVAGSLRLSPRMATARARDIAGFLMLIGLGASMMIDPAEALRSVAEIEAGYRAAVVSMN